MSKKTDEPLEVTMTYDEDTARGQVRIVRGGYGPEIYVNGVLIGCIDLYPAAEEGGRPQLILDDPVTEDRPLAKLVVQGPGHVTLILSREVDPAKRELPEQGIHTDWDWVVDRDADDPDGEEDDDD